MEKPKLRVSIVVLAYNEEQQLPACLEAIAQQTTKPFEVIIVDNNSTDRTTEVARSFPFVKVIHEKRQGQVFAQQTGFNAARGDIIGRVDADTWIAPNWTTVATDYFTEHSEIAAVNGAYQFYDFPHKRFAEVFMIFAYCYMQRLLTGIWVLWGANMAIRREAWQQVSQMETQRTDLDEDIDLSLHLHKRHLAMRFSRKLRAETSALRGNVSLKSIVVYTSSWHKNYFANDMPVRGVLIYLLRVIGLAVMLPIFLIVRPKQH